MSYRNFFPLWIHISIFVLIIGVLFFPGYMGEQAGTLISSFCEASGTCTHPNLASIPAVNG